MNQVPHPRNWQTAASMVIDATFDLAKSAAVAECSGIGHCFEIICSQFDELVEEIFSNGEKDSDNIEELISSIAAYAMHGYAIVAQTNNRIAVNEIFDTIVGKQKMYGHGNIARFALPGIAIRLNDKIERLKNLQHHDGPVLFEPIKDTWLDIVGYSVIAIMWIHDWFLLVLKQNSTSTSSH
jgi:hypothetical protein